MMEVESKYPAMDDEMKVETAKELTWIRKNGYPSIMAHAKVTDPRFLVFVHWLMQQKFESLEDAQKRLKLTWRSVAKWWKFLKENQYLKPEIIEYYDSRPAGPLKGKKKREKESLEPPRSSSTRLEETLSKGAGKYKLRGMSEENERVIEIPEGLFKQLVAAGYIGDKRKLSQVVNAVISQYKDMEEVFKEVIQGGGVSQSRGISITAGNVDELFSKIQDRITNAYLLGEYIKILKGALGPANYYVNPDGSIGINIPANSPNESSAFKRIEDKIEKLIEALQKREEEDKFKAIEEKINQLTEKISKGGAVESNREIEALKEELRKLREERLKEDLKDTIEDLKETLASTAQGKSGGYDIIDAITKLDTLLKDREMKIEQLKAEVDKARDERFMQILENVLEQDRDLRSRLHEVSKNPLQAYQELADQISQLEKIMDSIRKGSSPKVDQDIKQRALNLLEETVSKVTDVMLGQKSMRMPIDVGAKLASLPCPNCGKPIPMPDLKNAKIVTCPHCGSQYEVAKQQV